MASGEAVLMPVFAFFKTVRAFCLELYALPFPITKTGSSGNHKKVEMAVVSLYCPNTRDANGRAIELNPNPVEYPPGDFAVPVLNDQSPDAIPDPKAVDAYPDA